MFIKSSMIWSNCCFAFQKEKFIVNFYFHRVGDVKKFFFYMIWDTFWHFWPHFLEQNIQPGCAFPRYIEFNLFFFCLQKKRFCYKKNFPSRLRLRLFVSWLIFAFLRQFFGEKCDFVHNIPFYRKSKMSQMPIRCWTRKPRQPIQRKCPIGI